jgi:hypothetical protein
VLAGSSDVAWYFPSWWIIDEDVGKRVRWSVTCVKRGDVFTQIFQTCMRQNIVYYI